MYATPELRAVTAAWLSGYVLVQSPYSTDGVTLKLYCTPVAWKASAKDVKLEQPVTLTYGGWDSEITRRTLEFVHEEVAAHRGLSREKSQLHALQTITDFSFEFEI